MEVTIIFKIAAVGILVSILSQVLKHSGRDEQAFLVSLAGLLIVLFWIVPYIYELFVDIQKLFVLLAGGKMDIIKISLLGICGVILCFFLKETRPEYTAFITMGIGIMILGLAVGKLEYLFGTLRQLKDSLPVEQEYLTTLIKMIGITYIGQFSAGICKDAGHQATAAQIELFCRLSVLVQNVPILLALLETIQEFMA